MSYYCNVHGSANDVCSDCFNEAIKIIKEFMFNEETYCQMLSFQKTEAHIRAEEFLKKQTHE